VIGLRSTILTLNSFFFGQTGKLRWAMYVYVVIINDYLQDLQVKYMCMYACLHTRTHSNCTASTVLAVRVLG
jgi:hypothetical protein